MNEGGRQPPLPLPPLLPLRRRRKKGRGKELAEASYGGGEAVRRLRRFAPPPARAQGPRRHTATATAQVGTGADLSNGNGNNDGERLRPRQTATADASERGDRAAISMRRSERLPAYDNGNGRSRCRCCLLAPQMPLTAGRATAHPRLSVTSAPKATATSHGRRSRRGLPHHCGSRHQSRSGCSSRWCR